MLIAQTDNFETMPVQFQPGCPPFIPNINTFGLDQQVPFAVTNIINEAADKATANCARTYVWNILSRNGFNNQHFTEIIQLLVAYAKTQLDKRIYNNPQLAIDSLSSKVLAAWTSGMVVITPELRGMIPHNVLKTAEINAGGMNEIRQEVSALINNQGNPNMNYPGQMYPGQMYPVQQTNPGMIQHNQMQMNMHPAMQAAGRPFIRNDYGNQQPQQPQINTQYQTIANNNQNFNDNRFPVQQQIAPEKEVEKILTSDDWEPSTTQLYRKLYDAYKFEPVYQYSGSDVVEVFRERERLVDRAKHQLTSANRARITKTEQDIITANMVSVEQINKVIIEDNDEESTDFIKSFLHKSVCFFEYLDEACNAAAVGAASNKSAFYRAASVVINPIVTKDNHHKLIAAIRKCGNFSQIRRTLLGYGVNCDDVDDAEFFVQLVNKFLTNLVNDLLKNSLSIKITIDDFENDIESLRPYLADRLTPRFMSAFDAMESFVCERIFADYGTELIEAYKEDGVNTSHIPVSYVVTYIDVTSDELAIQKFDEARLITSNFNSYLIEVCKNIEDHADVLGCKPMKFVVITKDMIKYEVYKGFLSDGSWLINQM